MKGENSIVDGGHSISKGSGSWKLVTNPGNGVIGHCWNAEEWHEKMLLGNSAEGAWPNTWNAQEAELEAPPCGGQCQGSICAGITESIRESMIFILMLKFSFFIFSHKLPVLLYLWDIWKGQDSIVNLKCGIALKMCFLALEITALDAAHFIKLLFWNNFRFSEKLKG